MTFLPKVSAFSCDAHGEGLSAMGPASSTSPSMLAPLGLLIHTSQAPPVVLPPPQEVPMTPRGHKRR